MRGPRADTTISRRHRLHRNGLSVLSSPAGVALHKPFSGYSPAPTTSPYLNLFREDFAGNSDLNYNTLVRPQLQQQAFNQQVQRQGQEMVASDAVDGRSKRLQPAGGQKPIPHGSPDGHEILRPLLSQCPLSSGQAVLVSRVDSGGGIAGFYCVRLVNRLADGFSRASSTGLAGSNAGLLQIAPLI